MEQRVLQKLERGFQLRHEGGLQLCRMEYRNTIPFEYLKAPLELRLRQHLEAGHGQECYRRRKCYCLLSARMQNWARTARKVITIDGMPVCETARRISVPANAEY
jgi:hypothetical protein